MRKTLVPVLCTLVVAVLQTSALGASSLPLPTDDRGLFLNILPAGQGTTTTTQDALQYEFTGDPPPHDIDQLDMYASLPANVPINDGDLPTYFKPETFLVPGADVERTEDPKDGLTILRDKMGVPHIYGDTRADAMWGAGYVTAEDRLFLADVLRHVGRGRLSEFLGPSKANLQMDRDTYLVAGYNEKELTRQVNRLSKYGPVGDQAIADGKSFIDGINARIDEDLSHPDQMPAEYAALQIQPEHWTPGDIVAVATLIQATFAAGGGGELQNAIFLRNAQHKLGSKKGRAVFRDLRTREDPGAPVTADGRFPYGTTRNVDPGAVAIPALGSVKNLDILTTEPSGGGRSASVTGGSMPGESPIQRLRDGLVRLGLAFPDAASNWLAVTADRTAAGHPIAVMGPQVGYWSPEVLMETDIHAPGLDARGATFPGVSLYVLLGRGPDFAWSATSGESDLVDVRAERLCEPGGGKPTTDSTHYLYKGKCVAMYTRNDTWFAKPSAGGTGPPTRVTAHVRRTKHGPVFATGVVKGHPVAFSSQRSTFFGELDSALPFVWANGWSGGQIHDPQSFKDAFNYMTGSFNWLYVDDQHVAYFHSGKYPIRARGVDPNLPSWGTGRWEWRGFVTQQNHPQAVDPAKGWIDSWNNKPARGWRSADDIWTYGPVHRVEMLATRLAGRVPQGGVTPADMVNIMGDAATVDLRGQEVLPVVLDAIGRPSGLGQYVDLMRSWVGSGAHRVDRNGDGQYDDQAAAALMDAWWPRMIHAVFDRQLAGLYGKSPAPLDDTDRTDHLGSSYLDGYYGFVQTAVREALGLRVARGYGEFECANGTLKGCRKALRSSLSKAVQSLGSDTSKWNAHEDSENIHFTAVGLVEVDPILWQNRPTFQQVVQATSHR